MTETEKEYLYSTFKLSSINEIDHPVLTTFTCEKNPDLENFIHSIAMDFETRQILRTFILTNNDMSEIVAYFTISMKSLSTDGMTASKIKQIDGISKNRLCIHSYLIGQLGVSDLYDRYKLGALLLDDAFVKIEQANALVGGRYILVDAINHPKVIKFYTENEFKILPTDNADESIASVKMIYKIEN